MYRKILLPTDGSLLSDAAIAQGVELAKSMGATLVGMTVTAPFHTFALDPLMVSDTKESYKKDCEALATKYLDAIKAVASAAGVPCEVTHVDASTPTRESSKRRRQRGATSSSWLRTGAGGPRPWSLAAKP